MRQIQICAQGHRWDPEAESDRRADRNARWNVCPVCGASADVFSFRDTNATESTPSAEGHPAKSPPPHPPTSEPKLPGYEILSILGYGGMGVVYKARQIEHDRIVALKMLSAGVQARPTEVARFRTEGRAVSRLQHAHIVKVWEVGEHNGLPYFALEYMDRGHLGDAVAANPLPPRAAAELVEMLARGVQAAHGAGIIHRDLKPANILLTTPPPESSSPAGGVIPLLGMPKVSDFGLAKRLDEEGGQTRTGAVMGTPSYMSPEQAEGKTKVIGPATDVYALGAILFECLTGQPPFKGATVLETLDQVRFKEATSPSTMRPGVPRDLETICLKCLNKDPAARYANAGALADDLRRHLDGLSIEARPTPAWKKTLRRVTRRPAAVALAALSLALVALVAWLILRDKNSGTPDTPAADKPPETEVIYYAGMIKKRGLPVGIHRLTEEESKKRQLAFRFHLRKGQVEKVEALGRRGRLTISHDIETYLETAQAALITRRVRASNFPTVNPFSGLAPTSGALLGAALRFRSPFPSTEGLPVCSWEYQRDERGQLQRERGRDASGRVSWTFKFTAFTDRTATGYYEDERGYPRSRTGSGATHVELVFTDDGLVKEQRYRSGTGKPRPDAAGIFGKRFEHDANGFVATETLLGPNDQPMLSPNGYSRIDYQWDGQGNLLQTDLFDLRGKPANELGRTASRSRTKYDANGNPIRIEALNLKGDVTSIIKRTYDTPGNLLAIDFLDANEKPRTPSSEFGPFSRHVRQVFDYDEHDNCIRTAFFDADGKPVASASSPIRGVYVAVAYKHDADGRITEITYLDAAGKPTPIRTRGPGSSAEESKAARITQTYNARGQIVESAAWDVDGTLTADPTGVARVAVVFDNDGRLIEETNYGADNKPLPPQRPGAMRLGGCSKRTVEYRDGNLAAVSFFGPDGKLTDPAEISATADPGEVAFNQLSLVAFVQRPGFGPTAVLAGRLTFKYDDWGNITEVGLFGRDSKPAADGQKISTARCRYDELGNMAELSTFGVDGKPMASNRGVARTTATYDELGNMTEVATFGADGKLFAPLTLRLIPRGDGEVVAGSAPNSVARHKRQFRGYDLVEESFYGTDDKPTLGRVGYWRAAYTYDNDGRLTGSTYFNLEDKPVPTRVVCLTMLLPVRDPELGDIGLLEPDDVIEAYDGKEVRCARQFLDVKDLEPQGESRKMRLIYGGKSHEIDVPTGPLYTRGFAGSVFNTRRSRAFTSLTPGELEVSGAFETRAESHLPKAK